MATPDGTQDLNAQITWQSDWTLHLAANGGLTITAQSVTASGGATVAAQSHTATAVQFKLVTSSVTFGTGETSTDVVVTVQVTLSNGDTDVRRLRISVTNN